MKQMPVLFVGHGSPMNIVEPGPFTDAWGSIAKEMPIPQAILCISAHWYIDGNLVSSTAAPRTIHDFTGFPEALYQMQYLAPGAPKLAKQVTGLLDNDTATDGQRGLDHGAWSVLHYLYPAAQIPVCQLSVNARHTAQQNYALGKVLRPLRQDGVLILGSGNIVHNLALVDWNKEDGYDWADAFDTYIREAVTGGRFADAVEYEQAGASTKRAFHYRDHFDPLMYALGAAQESEPVHVFNDARTMGALSMTSYRFG